MATFRPVLAAVRFLRFQALPPRSTADPLQRPDGDRVAELPIGAGVFAGGEAGVGAYRGEGDPFPDHGEGLIRPAQLDLTDIPGRIDSGRAGILARREISSWRLTNCGLISFLLKHYPRFSHTNDAKIAR